ncbi:TonB-dependent receptor family protein [Runella sp.]|uniref:TonB-dependent receptor family protein n=1 Tax=Runella sp. TaxID=1960881 RepID=UPI003D14FC38
MLKHLIISPLRFSTHFYTRAFVIAGLFFSMAGFAQKRDSLRTLSLSPVIVTTTRLETNEKRLPAALTVLDGSRIQIGQPQLSLFESLGGVAGLFAQNPDNFNQDLRISIRGFGARAAFGIRGIRLVVDGIPESTPDGQADIDNLDMGAMRRVEVMRGPSSGLYGNAAGGIISLQTDNAADMPLVEGQATVGSYGFRSFRVKTGLQKGKFQYVLIATNNQSDGYRGNSRMESSIFNLKLRYDFDSLTRLSILANYGNSPQADDPGGLTMAQVTENRRQAHPNNIRFLATESVSQGRIGIIFEKRMGKSLIFARVFGTKRDFANYLAFQAAGAGTINREFAGASWQYQYAQQFGDLSYRFRLGIDLETQADTRRRFDNLTGVRGKLTFDQVESFKNTAAYITQELGYRKITLLTGLRSDAIRMKAEDAFLSDGDQSGKRQYSRINPTIGISYELSSKVNIYTNIGTSFETPTLSELSNNPSGTGGLNPDLNPQRATNYEIGAKTYFNRRVRFDIALFNINVEDELVPYQITGQAGRVFYRNAGSSRRQGIELSFNTMLAKGLSLFSNYTYSDFKYRHYQTTAGEFDGNILPGIPKHAAQVELRYFRPSGLFAIAQVRHASDLYADDANAVTANGYTNLNLRIGGTFHFGRLVVEPFVGVNNLLNAVYFQNVQINAANGRYFEPAQGQFWFGGMKVNIQKKS